MYAQLAAMGEGARRPGDRSDISSDEEDEMEVCVSLLASPFRDSLDKCEDPM